MTVTVYQQTNIGVALKNSLNVSGGRALFGAGNAHFHFRDCQEREKGAAWILTAGHPADPG
jgi:hypothetical protein